MLSTENQASESWSNSSDELHGMISLLTFLGIPFSSLLWQPLKVFLKGEHVASCQSNI